MAKVITRGWRMTDRGWIVVAGRLWRWTVAMTLVAMISACSHVGNDRLEISPKVFSECGGPNTVVRVTWDATPLTTKPVDLFVHKPGQRPTLWRQDAPKGAADTGHWASDGWTVTLVDSSGRLLATRTLESRPCDKGPDA